MHHASLMRLSTPHTAQFTKRDDPDPGISEEQDRDATRIERDWLHIRRVFSATKPIEI